MSMESLGQLRKGGGLEKKELGTWRLDPRALGARVGMDASSGKQLWFRHVKDMVWVCIPDFLLNN